MSQAEIMKQNPVKQALNYGQSIWYDGLVSKPEFEKMIREDGIRGATTNPTIFEKALNHHDYDAEINALSSTHNEEKIYQALAIRAVQEVADLFLPVFRETKGLDGFVSIEVSPLLAFDTEATIREVRELFRLVDRKNIMIKIPATPQGIPAIQAVIADGINVNITLIFSINRYEEVIAAYLSGLEKRVNDGKPISSVVSVASFFVSRVDTAVDKLLEDKIKLENDPTRSALLKNLLGKAGTANSKIAYAAFERVFSGAQFQRLKTSGAQAQKPLWASTGTKNPNYSDVLYVEALMGPQTVNTIPPATLDAFRDHGVAGAKLKEGLNEAVEALKNLREARIDLDSITKDLEAAGVRSFSDSYEKLIDYIKAKTNNK